MTNLAKDRLYDVVAARRLQWDALLWQVPALSLTGQAFLLTIALGPSTSRLARIISSVVSLIASIMSMQLMTSDRQAEVADAHWLYDYEMEKFGEAVSGPAFRDRRKATDPDVAFPVKPFLHVRSFTVWMLGLSSFGVVGLLVFVVTIVRPSLLHG
jgi:hypothetical protein